MLKYPELYKTSQNAMGFNTKVTLTFYLYFNASTFYSDGAVGRITKPRPFSSSTFLCVLGRTHAKGRSSSLYHQLASH